MRIPIRIHDPQDHNTGYLRDKMANPVERPTLSMKGITVSRSCSVILLDTESFINMLSISVTPTAYISDSRLEQAIRPEEYICLKGQCHYNVVESFPDPWHFETDPTPEPDPTPKPYPAIIGCDF